MPITAAPAHRRHSRKPIAACIAAVFSLTSSAAMCAGTTWTVNSCAEGVSGSGHAGTLRYVVANASTSANSISSADIIDLSTLPAACNSTITLTAGAVQVAQNFLNFKGRLTARPSRH